ALQQQMPARKKRDQQPLDDDILADDDLGDTFADSSDKTSGVAGFGHGNNIQAANGERSGIRAKSNAALRPLRLGIVQFRRNSARSRALTTTTLLLAHPSRDLRGAGAIAGG